MNDPCVEVNCSKIPNIDLIEILCKQAKNKRDQQRMLELLSKTKLKHLLLKPMVSMGLSTDLILDKIQDIRFAFLKKGNQIFIQGTPAKNQIYFLLSGKVGLMKIAERKNSKNSYNLLGFSQSIKWNLKSDEDVNNNSEIIVPAIPRNLNLEAKPRHLTTNFMARASESIRRHSQMAGLENIRIRRSLKEDAEAFLPFALKSQQNRQRREKRQSEWFEPAINIEEKSPADSQEFSQLIFPTTNLNTRALIVEHFNKKFLLDLAEVTGDQLETLESTFGKIQMQIQAQELLGLKELNPDDSYKYSAVGLTNCQLLVMSKEELAYIINAAAPEKQKKIAEFLRLVLNWESIWKANNKSVIYSFISGMTVGSKEAKFRQR